LRALLESAVLLGILEESPGAATSRRRTLVMLMWMMISHEDLVGCSLGSVLVVNDVFRRHGVELLGFSTSPGVTAAAVSHVLIVHFNLVVQDSSMMNILLKKGHN